MTFHIYESDAAIELYYPQGGGYCDGQSASLSSCTTYDIEPANMNNGHSFGYWYGTNVYIGNSLSSSTWFTPAGNGVLMLILKHGPSGANTWAGYVQATPPNDIGLSFSSVQGTITLPTSISYYGNGTYVSGSRKPCSWMANDSYDLVSYWIGLGGWTTSNNGGLWQVGADLWVRSSGVHILEWW